MLHFKLEENFVTFLVINLLTSVVMCDLFCDGGGGGGDLLHLCSRKLREDWARDCE